MKLHYFIVLAAIFFSPKLIAVETFGIKNIYTKPIYIALGNKKNPNPKSKAKAVRATDAVIKQLDPGQMFTAKIDLTREPEFWVAPYYPVPGDKVWVYSIQMKELDKKAKPTSVYVHINFVKEESKKAVLSRYQLREAIDIGVYKPELTLPASWFDRNISYDNIVLDEMLYPLCTLCDAYKILSHMYGLDYILNENSSPYDILGLKEGDKESVQQQYLNLSVKHLANSYAKSENSYFKELYKYLIAILQSAYLQLVPAKKSQVKLEAPEQLRLRMGEGEQGLKAVGPAHEEIFHYYNEPKEKADVKMGG